MTVSTPSASELSACTCAEAYGENPECPMHGRGTEWAKENPDIAEIFQHSVDQAKRIEELEEERDHLRNGWEMDRLESAEVLGEAQALLSEAEKVLETLISNHENQDIGHADFRVGTRYLASNLLAKLREATK